ADPRPLPRAAAGAARGRRAPGRLSRLPRAGQKKLRWMYLRRPLAPPVPQKGGRIREGRPAVDGLEQLISFAMGELDATEAAAVEQRLATDTRAALAYAALTDVIAALRSRTAAAPR